MKKRIFCLMLMLLVALSMVACSSDSKQDQGKSSRPEISSANNALVGRWSSLSDVGHMIENSFGVKNDAFYITVEYCFKSDDTFTFEVTNVDEEELRNLVTEDSTTGNAKQIDGTVEIIAEALYFQTDRGTYEIDGDKLILHAKQGTMEFDLQVIDDENIVMTRDEKSAELTKVGNP